MFSDHCVGWVEKPGMCLMNMHVLNEKRKYLNFLIVTYVP